MEEDTPPNLFSEEEFISLAFNPKKDILSCGFIDGSFSCFEYSLEENRQLFKLQPHQRSCQDIVISSDGNYAFTASSDLSICAIDLNQGTVCYQNKGAHEHSISRLFIYEHLLASGDDEGFIKIWDLRSKKVAFKVSENADFISNFAISPETNTLLATSGDGCLTVINLKKGKVIDVSEQIEDEFLSVQVVKDGKKVICGTQLGSIKLFSWGDWEKPNDQLLGHPLSIDTMVKIDESTVFTGSSDGIIRIVQILPNKLIGVVGEHSEDVTLPIEKLILSHDHKYLASCSHDSCVKFWNVSDIFDEKHDGEEEEEEEVGEADDIEQEGEEEQEQEGEQSEDEE